MPVSLPPLPLHDTPTVYGRISRLSHWAGALLVLGLLGLGLVFDELPRGDTRALLRQSHLTLGALSLLPLLTRVLWRVQALHSGHTPQPISAGGWKLRAEQGVHLLLLATMLLLLASGPLSIWADGDAIHLFGRFDLPSPIPPSYRLHRVSEIVHALGSKLLIGLLGLHLLGVARHGRKSWQRMGGQVE
jgi:cytochrome b561